MPELESLLDYVRAEGRICPMPDRWIQLFDLLGPDAPPPLILAAWHVPALWKALRLDEQIRYAVEHETFDRVDCVLRGLRPDEWFCVPRGVATESPRLHA
jgi:hypothetical protein